MGVVVVLAIVAVGSIELLVANPPERAPRGVIQGTPTAGTLLLVRATEPGRDELWLLDLSTGTATRGPSIHGDIVDLVDVSGAGVGWVGLERRTRTGGTDVLVLRDVERDANVGRLGRGDMVAWGPDGRSVVIARNGPGSDGCSWVRIRLVSVETRRRGWALNDPGFCGPVVSISRSIAATYFTAPSGDQLGVYLTGTVGVPHLMFEDVTMLSAAPPSAFLLRPASASVHPEEGDASVASDQTLLGWRGIGGPIWVGRGDEPLVIDRVLAWSPDGDRVALIGSVGARRGVFLLDAGSGGSTREPEFVVAPDFVVDATFDRNGDLFVSRVGEILVVGGGSIERFPVPAAAGPLAGPVLWIP